jgi:hypothetical protein
MNKNQLSKELLKKGFIYENGYWFKNNNSDVLSVAHIDHVGKDNPSFYMDNHNFVSCISLDDRLGIYCILDIYPKLGIVTDILITDFEETGHSTAIKFDPKRKYNWIVELDRKLDGFVTYKDYAKYYDLLIYHFGTHHHGSFSDISILPQSFDTLCFNLGIGYNKEHTQNCYANLNHTINAIYNLKRFWLLYKDEPMNVDYIKSYRYDDWDYKPVISKKDIHYNDPSKWYLKCDYCEIEDNNLTYNSTYDVWLCEDCQKLFDNDNYKREA